MNASTAIQRTGPTAPRSIVVPEVKLPVTPWMGDDPAVFPYPQPSFIGWPAPSGYLPPYAPIIDYPAINSAQRLCSTIASSQCMSYECLNGVGFGVSPYLVDQTARLALDAGSRQFVQGLETYQSCVRAIMGGETAGPNLFI